MPNTFNTLSTFTLDGDTLEDVQPARPRSAVPGRREVAVLAENPAREPAAPRRQRVREGRRHQHARRMVGRTLAAKRNLLHAGPRPAAGLHRRPLRRRSGRDARRHRSRSAGIPKRSIPLQPVELVIDHSVQVDHFGRQTLSRSMPTSSTTATASAMSFCAGDRRPSATSGWSRPKPASSIRSTSSISRASCAANRETAEPRVSGHALRHRFAHDDGERSGCRGLGRRWYRGGSGDARPAELDAASAGRRLSADRAAA